MAAAPASSYSGNGQIGKICRNEPLAGDAFFTSQMKRIPGRDKDCRNRKGSFCSAASASAMARICTVVIFFSDPLPHVFWPCPPAAVKSYAVSYTSFVAATNCSSLSPALPLSMISFAIFTHSGMEQSSMPKYRLRAEFKITASRLGPFQPAGKDVSGNPGVFLRGAAHQIL